MADFIYTQNPELFTEESPKSDLMRQLVLNITSNTAAIRYTRESQANAWTTLYDDLETRFGADASDIFLGSLPSATKSKVHTPHPTECLTTRAIRKYNELMDLMLSSEADSLFAATPGNTPESVVKKIEELAEELVPPKKNLGIDHEMTRSIRASERSWDAIEIQMTAASKILGLRENHSNSYVPMEVLEAFYYTNEVYTWTPGDQDSKPDMVEELFLAGIEKNQAAMWQRYMKALADIASTLNNESLEKREIYAMMWKVMDTIDSISVHSVQGVDQDYLKQYFDKEISGMPNGTSARDEILFVEKMRHTGGLDFTDVFKEKIGDRTIPFFYEPGGYKKSTEFQTDLVELKLRLEAENIKLPKHRDDRGEETGFTELDVIISQVANFRATATKIQVRQNREMHEDVLKVIQNSLIDAGIIGKKMGATEMLELVYSAETGELTEKGLEISEFLRRKVTNMGDEIKALYAEKPYSEFDELEKVRFGFYQTLMTIIHALEHPDEMPKYIVAECKNPDDVLTPLLFMKLMTDPEKKKTIENYGLNEVFPLFEYRPYIESAKQTLLELENNAIFRQHGQIIQDSLGRGPALATVDDRFDKTIIEEDPALMVYDAHLKKRRAMTVADAKMMHGFEPKKGEENKTITRRQTIMVAGSDSRKGHGAFISPIIKYSIADSMEAMLERGVLLEFFMGAGGGKHRNYPTSAQMHTDQGSNNRLITAEEIAYNNMRFLAKNMRTMVGHNMTPDKPDQQKAIQERSVAACKQYETLYNSGDFSEYVRNGTTCHMAKIISYAARPSTRTRSGETDDSKYPPHIDVKNFRAIQYGAAMNGAGIALGMWYGASAFLGLGEDGSLSAQDRSQIIDLYRNTKTMKNSLDDAVYGMSFVDMEVAWKFLECTRSEDGQTITTKDGKEYKTADLAKAGRDTPADLQVLANIDMEYQKSARALHEIYTVMEKGRCTDEDKTKFKPEDIVELVHDGSKDQIKAAKVQIRKAREQLAETHKDLKDGTMKMPKKGMDREDDGYEENQQAYERIYYPSATLMEIFEHTPAAMRFKEYGRALEMDLQPELAA